MYEHVKTGCKHIPPSKQTLQFQSEFFLNTPRILDFTVQKGLVTVMAFFAP